jgi:hypothetical protein
VLKEKAKSSYTQVHTPFLTLEASAGQMTQVAGGPSKERMEQSISGPSPKMGPTTFVQRITEQPEGPNEVEHRSPAVPQLSTAPAFSEIVLPTEPTRHMPPSLPTSMPNENTAGFEPSERRGSLGSEPDQYTTTIHIHPDKHRPNLTEPHRCLLDTGSDFNLVSQKTLRMLSIPFNEREKPVMTLLGGVQFLPIGSVLLAWHMDKHKQVTYYEEFFVLSESKPPLFDLLLGKDWIRKNKALLRNPEVLLVRHLGSHDLPTSISGGAET